MIFEWDEDGEVYRKEYHPCQNPGGGHGYHRLILGGKDIEAFLKMPDSLLREKLENLYTRDMNF